MNGSVHELWTLANSLLILIGLVGAILGIWKYFRDWVVLLERIHNALRHLSASLDRLDETMRESRPERGRSAKQEEDEHGKV